MELTGLIFSFALQAYMLGYTQGREAVQMEGEGLPDSLRVKMMIVREGGDPLFSLREMMAITGWSRETVLRNIPAVRDNGHPAWRYSTYLGYCRDHERKAAGKEKHKYVAGKPDEIGIDAAVQQELALQMEKVRKRRTAQ